MAVVAAGKVAIIHFTLTREDGQLVESTRGKEPIAFLQGGGNLVPGLERALEGQSVGARLDVTVSPEDAFGLRKGNGPQAVPRREFPKHIKPAVGMPLEIVGSDGQPVRVWVTRIQGSRIWIDLDHPLAGHTVRFDVEVVGIRDPYPEELEHGHAHGVDGRHQH